MNLPSLDTLLKAQILSGGAPPSRLRAGAWWLALWWVKVHVLACLGVVKLVEWINR